MKYVVKCRYCDHSFIVTDEDIDFQCGNCGGQNTIEDVSERIDEPVIIEKEKPVYLREGVDPELQTIKNFDMSFHPVDEKEWGYENDNSKGTLPIWARISACVIVMIISILFRMFRDWIRLNF